MLRKLAVLKNSGGLGTSMGMTSGKGVLEVKPGFTCIDLAASQIAHLNSTYKADVPLLMMTSFNTHNETARILEKHNGTTRIKIFSNARYPRICAETLRPLASSPACPDEYWSPAGHGDLNNALARNGILEELLLEGREYLFLSNLDNIAPIVDLRILQHMIDTESEFLMELTDRTEADVKGGTLVYYRGAPMLLEIAQVPSDHRSDFMSRETFTLFNTNNLWIDLKAVKRIMASQAMKLDIIANPKAMPSGRPVLQLETAAGAAVKHFKVARGIKVPRARFIPIKQTSDLMLLRSGIYTLEEGRPVLVPERMYRKVPVPTIKLGDHFKKLDEFERRCPHLPNIMLLDHLSVEGDVFFGQNVTLRGSVNIKNREEGTLRIPDGAVLDHDET